MSSQKELKIVIEYVEKHGFKLVRHTKHLVFQMGDKTLTVSATPGDKHTLHNVKRNFLRMGVTALPLK